MRLRIPRGGSPSIVYFMFTPVIQMKDNPSETTRSAFNHGNTKYEATNKDYQ